MTDTVFLLDVDNTLLDNDAVIADLRRHLVEAFGAECDRRYWEIFEQLRAELGYADYLGALQRYRVEQPRETHVLQISLFLLHYPFANRLYPGALDAIRTLRARGRTVILSDGDVVFQPRKIERSGLWEAVEGEVLVYIHKEQMLDDVERRYPARRYVMVDDKLRILTAMKEHLARSPDDGVRAAGTLRARSGASRRLPSEPTIGDRCASGRASEHQLAHLG